MLRMVSDASLDVFLAVVRKMQRPQQTPAYVILVVEYEESRKGCSLHDDY